MDTKNNAYSYQYDELTSEESSEKMRSAESVIETAAVNKQPEFKLLMVLRKNETADFKNLIISVALILVSLGLIANLLFNLLIMCRKRKRQTATTLVMFSMSIAYFVYLGFYCLKLSVYFKGDSITKFHMYDTIDNWMYGAFLCRLISGLPFCCKLISRLSILTLCTKRLLSIFICDCSNNVIDSKETSQVDSDEIDCENTKLNEDNKKMNENKKCCQKLHLFKQVFEWPILVVVIASIWMISIGVTFPVFNSYKLNEPSQNSIQTATNICNSVFRFPEDIAIVSQMYFSYLIYGLVIPCGLILVLLIALFILQSNYCFNVITSSGSRSTGTSSSSSPAMTKRSKRVNSTANGSSTSSSSQSSFDEISATQCSRSTGNNLLLWLMFTIHLSTTLPQEIYRYFQLNINFNDEAILDNYLTASLIQPILKAKPYYAFQLIYISEFTIMPLVFILFFLCSMKRTRPTRSESDADLPNKPRLSSCTETACFKHLRSCLYDPELSKSKESKRYFLSLNIKDSVKKTPILLINDDVKNQTDSPALFNRENLLINNNNQPLSFPIVSNKQTSSSLRPTPFELANNNANNDSYNSNTNANLVHIIQHPSWRINIKQQHSPIREENTCTNTNLGSQMPFNYMKSNGYKS